MSIDPGRTYVFLSPEGSATQVPGGEAFWSRPQSEIEAFGQGWLVTEFECSADWPHWEMHPEGDEFVYLLSGEVAFLMQEEAGTRSVALKGRAAVVVPRGIWHTARTSVPSRMLFVTRGGGTQHRPLDQG